MRHLARSLGASLFLLLGLAFLFVAFDRLLLTGTDYAHAGIVVANLALGSVCWALGVRLTRGGPPRAQPAREGGSTERVP